MSLVLWLFEFGYLLQHLATTIQILRIREKRNTELVSLDTNILFLIGAFSRIIWMWDSMLKGFFLAYIEITLAFITLPYIIYLYNKYRTSDFYYSDRNLPVFLKLYVLLPVIILLSFLFHPGTKGKYYYTNQMFVSLGIFSEAIGLLPQLYLITKTKDTGNVSQYYGAMLGFARFFRLIFWIKMYIDGTSFLSLIVADVIHCYLLSTFVYNLIKNWNNAMLPTFGPQEVPGKKMF